MAFLSGAFFDVLLVGACPPIAGSFTSVSGLGMALDYETYQEGGSLYPRFFFNGPKPQTLVLEQGVVTSFDGISLLMGMCNQGMSIPLGGTISLKNRFGETQRVWTVVGAYLQRYVGPDLNSNQPALAVSRIELLHNGCY